MAENKNTPEDDTDYTAPDDVDTDMSDGDFYDDDNDEAASSLDTVTVAVSEPEDDTEENEPTEQTASPAVAAATPSAPKPDLGDEEDRLAAAARLANAQKAKRNKQLVMIAIGCVFAIVIGYVAISILSRPKSPSVTTQRQMEQARQQAGQNPAEMLARTGGGDASGAQTSQASSQTGVNPAAALQQAQAEPTAQPAPQAADTTRRAQMPAVDENSAPAPRQDAQQRQQTPDERLAALIETNAPQADLVAKEYGRRLSALEAEFADVKSNIENVTAVLNRLAVGLQQQNDDGSRVTTAYNNAQSAIKGVNRLTEELDALKLSLATQSQTADMPAPLPKFEDAGDYVIFSIVRDKAWVRHKSDSTKTYALNAGDKNTDFGEIYSVSQDQSRRWTVKTEVGTITEF